jgi:hypothetical protein
MAAPDPRIVLLSSPIGLADDLIVHHPRQAAIPRQGVSAGSQAVARSCARALGGITGPFTPSGWWNSLRREVDWYQACERRYAGPGPAPSGIYSAGELNIQSGAQIPRAGPDVPA